MIDDLIYKSFVTAWTNAGYINVVPAANIYYNRVASATPFPYIDMKAEIINTEVIQRGPIFVKYLLTLCNYSIGSVTDNRTTQRLIQSLMDRLAPNQSWHFVTNFLHCIPTKATNDISKSAMELFKGKDVQYCHTYYEILISES